MLCGLIGFFVLQIITTMVMSILSASIACVLLLGFSAAIVADSAYTRENRCPEYDYCRLWPNRNCFSETMCKNVSQSMCTVAVFQMIRS